MSELAAKRRNQILRAALQAVSDKGFDSVTLQDIADYAEVSKGVTSYYFNNKEDVLCHLLEWVTERIYQHEYAAIQMQTTALQKLKACVNAAFTTPDENKRFYRVYLEFLAKASRNPRYRQINDHFYENCWSLGTEIVSVGKSEGIFSEVDINKAAITIRALIDGCLIQWLMRDKDELHEYYRDTCYDTLVNYLTNKHENDL
ncbi:TetR/AcrR family transcriptional regulator [Paenibacillus sp. GP183]|jgi:TetR/AcrR family transcriptional regulator, fatty acid metabolism regulator protein|uniref:TetR/AcrR family transcriptional regulator n=1 Tax=Paenibacillus sp. GP183 TaxID=1882751 RepID=UPI00089BD485|nr:TetR/AcrR family transcriptional regulator [Paenibacillus sp. GP183]SEC76827.1 transcriptional regulator, TetR family [Paenibacillus sp. GP183]